jgi:hypothetical protein
MNHQQQILDDKLELAWLAGFIDGDGHISVVVVKRAAFDKFAPRISMSNTDFPTQEIVLSIIDKNNLPHGKTHFRNGKVTKNCIKHSNSWEIPAQGIENCSPWVDLLMPYLRSKSEKAAAMSEFIKLRNLCGDKAHYTKTELDLARKLITRNHTKIYQYWEELYKKHS